jgi:carbamoyl-phosphate synthase small subunit
MTTAYLVLADGSVFQGQAMGATADEKTPKADGELVFNTSMTGYQEMLTDPSYAGQIVMPTYPMIGNYGINHRDMESARIQVAGFVVREECETPSHYASTATLHDFLSRNGILGISGVDTRAVTRHIRSSGVMMGTITTTETPEHAVARLRSLTGYDAVNFVRQVTTPEPFSWPDSAVQGVRIAVVDCGVKYNILREFAQRGCQTIVLPATASADEVLTLRPDGVVFSPGPGDPIHNTVPVETAKALIGRVPMLGICLGHQVVAQAMGARTYKLKFGHRGGNHPVQDLETGRVSITAQNHGYAVDEGSLPQQLKVTHRNLNDDTVEGLRHLSAPVFTIQYHSEASPGPLDNEYIFDQFLALVGERVSQ